MTSKGKSKKNLAKETAKPPEEEEIKKQNDKETKKGNAKKAAPRAKLNATARKANEAQAEEELDVKENGEAHTAEPKQRKRNMGKANAATNGKVEAKGKLKKGQVAAASVDEKEVIKDVIAEIKTSEMNVVLEVDGNVTKDVSFSKDDNASQNEEEKSEVNESADSIDYEIKSIGNTPNLEIPSNEAESSESFLHH